MATSHCAPQTSAADSRALQVRTVECLRAGVSVPFATLPVRREIGGKFEIELILTYDVVMLEQVDCRIVLKTF